MSAHNRNRRKHKRGPSDQPRPLLGVLPMGDATDGDAKRDTQLSRRVNNLADKLAEYPKPPVYDATAAVRGRPEDRNTPQPVFIWPRFKSGSVWFTPPVACRVR